VAVIVAVPWREKPPAARQDVREPSQIHEARRIRAVRAAG
jgi:hypothetical protein